MIGMDLRSFLILLLISVAVSAVLHYGFKFYVRAGTGSFLSKAIIGWIGAWLGSPVFGHWPEGFSYGVVRAPRAGGGRCEIDLWSVRRR
jgi:uncharacterized membrane protein YeaQ/YmgE (transglycosylase-associated protein family)